MNNIREIKHLLSLCSRAQRKEIFRFLRREFPIHALEAQLNTRAEIILEAIARAGGLTLRMMRGVIAEAAFRVEVVKRLKGWHSTSEPASVAYDFKLTDERGAVRVQVKLQRSRDNRPMRASEANRLFSPDMYVVETQKTRAGVDRTTGSSTRPYRFGEFDLLAVGMHPSTNRWDTFMYTVTNWLLPQPGEPSEVLKFQPVPIAPNQDWTDTFETAVKWFRSRRQKTIRAQ